MHGLPIEPSFLLRLLLDVRCPVSGCGLGLPALCKRLNQGSFRVPSSVKFSVPSAGPFLLCSSGLLSFPQTPSKVFPVLSSMLPKCQCCFPFLDCRLDAKNCKRINLGGSQAAGYLQRLLQLKYPGHLAAITLSRMEEILHEHSYVAEDYVEGNKEGICLRLVDTVHRGCS